ncbi:DsbA family oxidoreductase [Cyclobacterium sp.]|uniref:DsbA family oxidoreductase n=1 Tax=Cyclobacterium sp. TaxID=1966343 RepID=UPI0025BC3AB2|nr:DsbA family oxidoreductase [Cyclobacterium sp.]
MQIEIWSDIVCPFCYIGKRKFEKALQTFELSDELQIIYRSFQLMPDMQTDPDSSVNEFLAREKGMTLEQVAEMNVHVGRQAAAVGLDYQLEKAIVANTFQAHRLLHHARDQNLQQQAKERFLKAYFTEGKNIDDKSTLIHLSEEIGLKVADKILAGDRYAAEVKKDILEARQLGIKGVPFFVFDRKYAVSGAQEAEVFQNTLAQAFKEWKTESLI